MGQGHFEIQFKEKRIICESVIYYIQSSAQLLTKPCKNDSAYLIRPEYVDYYSISKGGW